ncbi:MAG: hypothetical protein BZ135_07200 [Methanosphaera sp. rholeuAM6]|nr:MAG: hypothetical protein BZ135_07200 [Methanosphaera sp. rholeuAM6]
MEFIFALGFMLLALIAVVISTIATLVLGVAVANYLGLSGILWWSFIIVFWCIITSIIGKSSN